jgi:hypothetical protein
MTKIVINNDWGGFSISEKAVWRYAELKDIKLVARNGERMYGPDFYVDGIEDDEHYFSYYHLERTDTALIQVVEELGKEANGWCSSLKVVEIPDDVEWEIHEYDGWESVHEKHRVWS